MNWIGRTSPEDVTVDLSSGRASTLTTVTSGVSERVAKMLATMMINNKTPTDEPIMILPLRLTAILSFPLLYGELLSNGNLAKIPDFLRQANTTTSEGPLFQKTCCGR